MGKCQSQTAAIKSVFFEVMKNVAFAVAVAVVCAVAVAVAVADTFRKGPSWLKHKAKKSP